MEVDEAWLGTVAASLHPATITLLNLSRDQLDRVAEVRRLADGWRAALAAAPGTHVVANADDPLVAWAATGAAAEAVTWVGVGQPWRDDAAGCPSCGARIHFSEDGGWACGTCSFARPVVTFRVDGNELVGPSGRLPLALALPGRANRANAVMAAVTAARAGVALADALAAMTATASVDGRYRQAEVGAGTTARLLLAKNPAGWLEVFDMLAPPPAPVVVVVNARIADGRDPSWLWDVPFERLAGRPVAAAGERSRDLSVRLEYAEVDFQRIDDPVEAVRALGPGLVDVGANYTAMRQIDGRLQGGNG
jgi:UDP-N-acetylmuramyl tripeptide synthase